LAFITRAFPMRSPGRRAPRWRSSDHFRRSWRQIARAKKLGVPQALGLSVEEWVTTRLGGYIKLSIADRREAVKELAGEGLSNIAVGEILGVDETTIRRDSAARIRKPSCFTSWSQPGPAGGRSTSAGSQGRTKPASGMRRHLAGEARQGMSLKSRQGPPSQPTAVGR
jgi:hypothetical protein